MQKVKFFGEIVVSGEPQAILKLDRVALFETYIASLPVGQRLEITIEKESEDTTLSQWAYYFACIVDPLCDTTGYMKDEMDGVICRKLLTMNAGTEREYVKPKSRCNRAEIAKFIDQAIILAAGLGVVVCPPDKFWRQHK